MLCDMSRQHSGDHVDHGCPGADHYKKKNTCAISPFLVMGLPSDDRE